MDWSETEQTRLCGGVDRPNAALRTLYKDEGYSISHLSNVFDCSTSAIIEDLCDLGMLDADGLFPDQFPRYRTAEKYERWEHGPHCVRVHRLLMVAEHGFEAVANAIEIHHESFPWDNRSDALVLCSTRQEHNDLHADQLGDHEDQRELSEFFPSFVEPDPSQQSQPSETPAVSEETDDSSVDLEPQRTLDEFARV